MTGAVLELIENNLELSGAVLELTPVGVETKGVLREHQKGGGTLLLGERKPPFWEAERT